MELVELGANRDAEWDQRVSTCPTSGFMQSTAWKSFRLSEGYEALRLGVQQGNRLLGGCTLFRYPSDRLGGVVHAPEGPVLDWGDEVTSRAALKLIQAEARAFGELTGAVSFRIEPRLPKTALRILRNWRRSPVDVTPIDTLVIDVQRPEAELMGEMHAKARYNIGLAERRGVRVRASTDLVDLETFFRLFQATANRRKFFAEPYGFFLNLATSLFPVGVAEILLAEHEGECGAAMLLIHYGSRSTFMYGGSEPALKRHMPNHALQWAAMQRSRERGAVEYDLFGCDPFGSTDHPYYGFSRFKRQLGGRAVRLNGAMDLIFYDQLAERMVSELAATA